MIQNQQLPRVCRTRFYTVGKLMQTLRVPRRSITPPTLLCLSSQAAPPPLATLFPSGLNSVRPRNLTPAAGSLGNLCFLSFPPIPPTSGGVRCVTLAFRAFVLSLVQGQPANLCLLSSSAQRAALWPSGWLDPAVAGAVLPASLHAVGP